MITHGLSRLIGNIILITVLICGAIFGFIYFSSVNRIESDKIIKPEIQLVVKDNKIDTMYIYKKR